MIDIFIGKPPDLNRHHDQPEPAVRKEIRELLRIVRDLPEDRRKNTRDRRRQTDPDVIVDLSTRKERRSRIDRRQKQEFLLIQGPKRDRRRQAMDRRHLQNDGITVSLSSRPERRRHSDRRDTRQSQGPYGLGDRENSEEIAQTLDSIKGLVRKLRSLL